jgi:hypothetical protein
MRPDSGPSPFGSVGSRGPPEGCARSTKACWALRSFSESLPEEATHETSAWSAAQRAYSCEELPHATAQRARRGSAPPPDHVPVFVMLPLDTVSDGPRSGHSTRGRRSRVVLGSSHDAARRCRGLGPRPKQPRPPPVPRPARPAPQINCEGVFRYASVPWFAAALQLLANSGVHGVAVDVWVGGPRAEGSSGSSSSSNSSNSSSSSSKKRTRSSSSSSSGSTHHKRWN